MSDREQKSILYKIIRIINSTVDNAMLLIFLFLLLVGGYSLWDTYTINSVADQKEYQVYKPKKKDTRSFEDFQTLNPDVIGWLNVYGTAIDYPLLQGDNNDMYLNTAPDGSFALSGSIYLDYRNSPKFDDFNSIIHGHHMEKHKMFGDIGLFIDADYFDKHRYGSLYFNGTTYGIEFSNFIEVDAYDDMLYTPNFYDRNMYLNHIDSLSTQKRDIGLNEKDQIVLLSTCASMDTNGRHVLVGRLTDKVEKDPFANKHKKKIGLKAIFEDNNVLKYLLLSLVLLIFVIFVYKKKKREDVS